LPLLPLLTPDETPFIFQKGAKAAVPFKHLRSAAGWLRNLADLAVGWGPQTEVFLLKSPPDPSLWDAAQCPLGWDTAACGCWLGIA